ncbi:NADP-dependent oxidoreductase [Paenibacillus sp. P25]|nr:NADP-dependent oxidoreductase [Paenibacillus sp. P25]
MMVGQIAKIHGARAVGIAGTDDKIAYLTSELGFDAAVNYKTETSLEEALKRVCPGGVDVYFDNVGGPVSDAVMTLLNDYARIPVCGAISSYNKEGADLGPRVQPTLIKTRSLMKGFVLSDYANRTEDGIRDLTKWLGEGRLKYEETIKEGFEQVPQAFLELFEGTNLGKMLVHVGKE